MQVPVVVDPVIPHLGPVSGEGRCHGAS
jgi:hypothetical protein